MKILTALIALVLSSQVFAADSAWLLCKGKADLAGSEINLVLNSVEHRNGISTSGEQLRINELTLIFGTRLLTGSFESSERDSSVVELVTKDKTSNFSGLVSFDYANDSMTLKGVLTIDVELKSEISSTLTCEQMN
jgi:hypothetical protein